MKIPRKFKAGDSLAWKDAPFFDGQSQAMASSAAWQLVYELRGPSKLTLTGVPAVDGGWSFVANTATTAPLLPGSYVWAAYLQQGGERRSVEGGTLGIEADLVQVASPFDGRSPARRALDDCEAALAKFGKGGKVESYTIGGRSMKFVSVTELMSLRDMWASKVKAEITRRRRKSGGPDPSISRVRFR